MPWRNCSFGCSEPVQTAAISRSGRRHCPSTNVLVSDLVASAAVVLPPGNLLWSSGSNQHHKHFRNCLYHRKHKPLCHHRHQRQHDRSTFTVASAAAAVPSGSLRPTLHHPLNDRRLQTAVQFGDGSRKRCSGSGRRHAVLWSRRGRRSKSIHSRNSRSYLSPTFRVFSTSTNLKSAHSSSFCDLLKKSKTAALPNQKNPVTLSTAKSTSICPCDLQCDNNNNNNNFEVKQPFSRHLQQHLLSRFSQPVFTRDSEEEPNWEFYHQITNRFLVFKSQLLS